ncbi:MAG: hypothetical protein WC121_09405 [Candidatus Kapaibacterium sp.]
MKTIIVLIFFAFIYLPAQEPDKIKNTDACSDVKLVQIATLLGWDSEKVEVEPMELSDKTMSSSCKFIFGQEELIIDIEDIGYVEVLPTHIEHYVISEGSYNAETEFLIYEMNSLIKTYHISLKFKTNRSDEGMYEILESISNQIELKSPDSVVTYKF